MTKRPHIRRFHKRPGIRILTPVGLIALALLDYIGGLIQLFGVCLVWLFRSVSDCRYGTIERRVSLMDVRETVRQMQLVSWGAFSIAIVTVTSSGMVIAMETVQQLKNFGMASTYLGGGVAYATMREMAPVLTAVVATASVASSFTAQIASMKVTEQIDAIRVMGVNPVRYLVLPRFLAMTIMIPVLTVITDYCGIVGGFVIAQGHGIALSTYLHSVYEVVQPSDFVGGLIKSAVFGVLISLSACLLGLRSQAGASGVGRSTIASVVSCIILIYVWDTLLTAMIWHA